MNAQMNTQTNDQTKPQKLSKDAEQDYQFRISQISHEIRNPVTLINSYLQLLAKAHPEVTGFQYWDHVTSNMEFLITMLNEISSLNRTYITKKESTNIYWFLQSFVEDISVELKKRNIQILLKKESALPRLDIDPVKFKEVLYNLVRNSAEAIDQNGTIIIRAYFEDLAIMIEVSDDGPGIPNEHLPTLFDPFVTYKKEGTGLGLAITKNIIDAHNGTIRVSSHVGKGTSFTLRLPL